MHFWEGTKAHKLLLQRDRATGQAYFPPRAFSPFTGSRDIEVFEASGKATLHSYVINQRPGPGFDGPTAIAVVELAEGPRMMTNIIDVAQTEEALVLDMELEVAYLELDDTITLPVFRPATKGSAQ